MNSLPNPANFEAAIASTSNAHPNTESLQPRGQLAQAEQHLRFQVADPLLDAINAYREAMADYCANATDDNEDEYARATYDAPLDVLSTWTEPAHTKEGALAALELALEDMENFASSPLSKAMISAALGFLLSADTRDYAHPDAELLRLGSQLTADNARWKTLPLSTGEPHDDWTDEEYKAAEEEYQAAHQRCSSIVDRIEVIPPKTTDGLRIKAQAYAWCRGGEGIELYDPETTDVRLAAQIVRTLLAT